MLENSSAPTFTAVTEYARRALSALIPSAAILLLAGSFGPLRGAALPIVLDGQFEDWNGIAPVFADHRGDGRRGGLDLRRLWIAHDGRYLFLRIEVGRETLLQNPVEMPAGNGLRLYLDLDGRPETGRPSSQLGVEVEVRFGEREILVYDEWGRRHDLRFGGGEVIAMPTHSSRTFEIRLDLRSKSRIAVRLGRMPVELRLLLEEEGGGDRLPDTGSLTYLLPGGKVAPLETINLDASERLGLRVLSLNVEVSTISSRQGVYRRLLRALRPDLVNFQEILNWSAEETRDFVQSALGPPANGTWEARRVDDCVTVSSLPILSSARVDGNLVTYIDLPDSQTPRDLVLFNVHTPCCGNEEGRDLEHDHLAAAWRDLIDGQGPFPIDRGDAVMLVGDFNMVGFKRQLKVIRQGVFIDPAHGPDFRPGRSDGALAVAPLRHTHARTVSTWRRRSSDFAPGRLDWIFFSGDVMRLERSFVLDTRELPAVVRRRHGLRRRDSPQASDHLALVADFTYRGAPNAERD